MEPPYPDQPPSPMRSQREGWVESPGDRWDLYYNGKPVAIIQRDSQGVSLTLDCRKMWQLKRVRAASIGQAIRYAERWCAARIYPGLPLREAVARLTEMTSEQRRQAARLDAVKPPNIG